MHGQVAKIEIGSICDAQRAASLSSSIGFSEAYTHVGDWKMNLGPFRSVVVML